MVVGGDSSLVREQMSVGVTVRVGVGIVGTVRLSGSECRWG